MMKVLTFVSLLATIELIQHIDASELRDRLPKAISRKGKVLHIVLESALEEEFVDESEEEVKVNIDCMSWLQNFPGGKITWLKFSHDVSDTSKGVNFLTHKKFEIGGDSNRWLNVTIDDVQDQDVDHVNYICHVCQARTGVNQQSISHLEECHNATLTLHLLGASSVIKRSNVESVFKRSTSEEPDNSRFKIGKRQAFGPDNCLVNRLDVIPCEFRNPNLVKPSWNQQGIYTTVLRTGSAGSPICGVRTIGHKVQNIPTVGQVKLLYSPGYLLHDTEYADQQLQVLYNVSCPEGQIGYFDLLDMQLEGANCYDPYLDRFRCTDYILVNRPPYGTMEYCGNITEPHISKFNVSTLNASDSVQASNIEVTFRTRSISAGFAGFRANVVCFRPQDRDLPGCTEDQLVADIEYDTSRRRRQADPPITDDSVFSDEDIILALMNENSCNPVLRASALSTIEFVASFNSSRVSILRSYIQTVGQTTEEPTEVVYPYDQTTDTEPTVTEMDVFPSTEYPYDPYEPEDPFDPYPFYYCELNEDEYGRPYYGPYDQHIPPSRLTPDSLPSHPSQRSSSLSYHIPPRPYVAESPSIWNYAFNLRRLTNSRKSDVLNIPSCILSNECNNSPEQCSGDSTQYDSCGRRCTCKDGQLVDCCRVRKEWRSMTQVERCRYVHVIHLVSTRNPWKKCYDSLINIHEDRFRSGIHELEFFLPFHRWYILALENLLRQVDCNITVPYWDWSLEPQSWQKSTFWAAECGFGGDGDPSNNYHVKNGDFSQSNNWQLASAAGGSLRRHFDENVPDCATIAMIQRTGIAEFNTWHNFVSSNLHDSIHCNIGGTMCTSSAANSPEFFLTQGFIDQIWASWQNKGYSFKNLPFFSRNDNLMPGAFGYSPADVYDLDNQPGCVKICIEASSRPCRINTTYTPMCPLNMMQSDYSPIKLANAIPKPYPYVPEASNLLFERPFEIQRSANRFSTLLNNRNELQLVLENSGYGTGANGYHPTRGEIQFDRYIYQPELVYPDTFAPNGTRLGPPRECQQYLTECP